MDFAYIILPSALAAGLGVWIYVLKRHLRTYVRVPKECLDLSDIVQLLVEQYDKHDHLSPEFKRDKVYKLTLRNFPKLKRENKKWMVGLAIELVKLRQYT
jgi:hypothetical protein